MRIAAVALAIALGCGGTPPRVPLTAQWPAQPGDFDDLTEAWTRHDSLSGGYQQIIELYATFKSPEWQLAYLTRTARQRGLDQASTDKLIADAKAMGDKQYEFELVVSMWDRMQNHLHRKDAVWQVTLIDDKGTSIVPLKIQRDKRPRTILRAEYPEVDDFAEAYIATFPRPPELLGPDVKQLRLRVSSPKGYVEVAWDAR